MDETCINFDESFEMGKSVRSTMEERVLAAMDAMLLKYHEDLHTRFDRFESLQYLIATKVKVDQESMAAISVSKSSHSRMRSVAHDKVKFVDEQATDSKGMNIRGTLVQSQEVKVRRSDPEDPQSNDSDGKLEALEATARNLTRSLHDEPLNTSEDRLSSVQRIVSHWSFEVFVSALVLGSLIALLARISLALQQRDASWLTVVEVVFCCFFTAQFVLRLLAIFSFSEQSNSEWQCWITDSVVVISGWLFVGLPVQGRALCLAPFFRTLRLASVLRTSTFFRCFTSVRSARITFWAVNTMFLTVLPLLLIAMLVTCGVMLTILQETAYLEDVDREVLGPYWATPTEAMLSLYKSVIGEEWDDMSGPLRDVSFSSYGIFVVYVGLMRFLFLGLAVSLLVGRMSNAQQKWETEAETQHARCVKYVKAFSSIIGEDCEAVGLEEFCHMLHQGRVNSVLAKLGVSTVEAEQLFYSLSAHGKLSVRILTFVLGCVKLRETATKMDLLTVTNDVGSAMDHRLDRFRVAIKGEDTVTALNSIPGKKRLDVRDVPLDAMKQMLAHEGILSQLASDEDRTEFQTTVARLMDVILAVDGGCGFVIAPVHCLAFLQQQGVDFQSVDRSSEYPNGYMQETFKDVHISDRFFLETMLEFTSHTDTDRWPEGHAAYGLPKDGYMLVSPAGYCIKCATKIVGLPMAPYAWEGVGTRHSSALAACWALRLHPSCVLVRSDSGKVHGLVFKRGRVDVLTPTSSRPTHRKLTGALPGVGATKSSHVVLAGTESSDDSSADDAS